MIRKRNPNILPLETQIEAESECLHTHIYQGKRLPSLTFFSNIPILKTKKINNDKCKLPDRKFLSCSKFSNPKLNDRNSKIKFYVKDIVEADKKSNIDQTKVSQKLNKQDLRNFEFISTIWDKVILCFDKKSYTLFALDQHAIHERISYEIYSDILNKEIFQNYQSKEFDYEVLRLKNKSCVFIFYLKYNSVCTNKIFLEPEIIKKISNFKHLFEKWGFKLELSLHENAVFSYRCPTFFGEKLEFAKNYRDFIEFFEERPDSSTNKNYQFPKVIDIILMFKACKNAIKFNDKITEKEVEILKRNLRKCEFPFVCVHGRNAFFPMMSLR
jgi:DNA mismatch repair ATPase MutL